MPEKPSSPFAGLLALLESPVSATNPLVSEGTEAFIAVIDAMAKVLEECGKGPAHGIASYAERRLLAQCFNDLLVGFYLVRHGYFQQGFAAMRSVTDALMIIDLLQEKPEMADVWREGGKRNWGKLMREAKRLKSTFSPNPLFSFYSEAGAHSTFLSGKMMNWGVDNEDGTTTIVMTIGGVTAEPAFTYGFYHGSVNCLMLCSLVQDRLTKVLKDCIPEVRFTEMLNILAASLNRYLSFLKGTATMPIPDQLLEATRSTAESTAAWLKKNSGREGPVE